MLTNHIKIAWRSILRDKGFSLINIGGLAIGIAACLLILQYVTYERSYDRFHTNADRIYRVKQDRFEKGVLATEWAAGAYAVGNVMKDHFPEIESYVKVYGGNRTSVVEWKDRQGKADKAHFATKDFFHVFSYPLLVGDPQTALAEPNTIVLSESLARTLFGKEDPMGQTLQIDRQITGKVTGVFKDFPANTHLKSDILVSFETFRKMVNPENQPDRDPDNAWNWDGCLTYLLLKPGTDAQALEAKFPAFVAETQPDTKTGNFGVAYFLQPLTDIHLKSHYMEEAELNGDGTTVSLLLGIAFFIIVIAWINYINLATARAMRRAREVGVRKVVGSFRWQLIRQFLVESALLNGIAVVVALALLGLALPMFNFFTSQELTFSLLLSARFWAVMVALFLGGTLLSGTYPAFVLSGFRPIAVLKGEMRNSAEGSFLRKGLVVFQFAASIFLLAGTLTVFRQISFMRAQSLGMNIDQTVVLKAPSLRNDSTFERQTLPFKQEMLRESNIKSVTVSTVVPGDPVDWNAGGIRLTGADQSESKQYRVIGVDYDFVNAYNLKLVAGRPFSKEFGNDRNAVIFNEAGLKLLGLAPEAVIGRQIEFWSDTCTVVGVAENFHQQSLREAYEPLILRLQPDMTGKISLKVATGDLQKTLATIREGWLKFYPGNPFEYFFLDEHFDDQYRADQRFGQVFGLFTLLGILVACMGLSGLASFTATQRTKEIGVRKVLGASVFQIVEMLYREFALLILIAFVLVTPLAWYASGKWLEEYSFRVDIAWWQFALPFLVVLSVGLLTVSVQSLKAALTNPAKSLRSE